MPRSLTASPPDVLNLNPWPSLHSSRQNRSHAASVPPSYRNERLPYSLPEESVSTSEWGASTMPRAYNNGSRHESLPPVQDAFSFCGGNDVSSWGQDQYTDALGLNQIVTELGDNAQPMAFHDENVLDLRFEPSMPCQPPLSLDTTGHSRRPSGSSFSTSSGGPSACDYTSSSGFNLPASTLSPIPSPRKNAQSPNVGNVSRGRAASSPRHLLRSAPYQLDALRMQRWSSGSPSQSQSRRRSSSLRHTQDRLYTPLAPPSSQFSSPDLQMLGHSPSISNLPFHQPYLGSQSPAVEPDCDYFPSISAPFGSVENSLSSNGVTRMLSSNADSAYAPRYHYADLSDPPDLFGCLREEQSSPPPEDMDPSDPDMKPHEQELRFEGDLYTPKWVRGQGNKREGWCGICKPGRWLVLKNSAFWYDKSFSHGVSATTGHSFPEPQETRRMEGNPDAWEGLCGCCNDWLALVSSKKKGTTWFRHAYKCHTHAKTKESSKRKRLSGGREGSAFGADGGIDERAVERSTFTTPTPPAEPSASRTMVPPRHMLSPLDSLTKHII